MPIAQRFERCHTCIYYQELKRCSVRDVDDKYNERCTDYIRVKDKIEDNDIKNNTATDYRIAR